MNGMKKKNTEKLNEMNGDVLKQITIKVNIKNGDDVFKYLNDGNIFPVDAEKIANKLGITVLESDIKKILESKSENPFAVFTVISEEDNKKCIIIDKKALNEYDDTDANVIGNFMIAYILGAYFLYPEIDSNREVNALILDEKLVDGILDKDLKLLENDIFIFASAILIPDVIIPTIASMYDDNVSIPKIAKRFYVPELVLMASLENSNFNK